ncbi:MAG: ankyrin repeat domain-containing protein [Planctomycetota bacterium]
MSNLTASILANDLEGLTAALSGAKPHELGSAFQMAAQREGTCPLLRALLEAGVEERQVGYGLSQACERGLQENVAAILAARPGIRVGNRKGDGPLYQAARRGDLALVELLLGAGDAEPLGHLGEADHEQAPDGWHPLLAAIEAGAPEVVTRLLAAGCDPNFATRRQRSPLDLARALGNEAVVRALERGGARPLDPAWLDLQGAARSGAVARVQELIPAASEEELAEALWSALLGDHEPVVEALIARGLPPERLTHAFSQAVRLSRFAGAEALLAAGADLNGPNEQGKTALYWAAGFDAADGVRWLAARGADLEAVDRDGETALHRACDRGCRQAVEALLAAGANVKAKDARGKTPAAFAKDYPELKALLKAAGAAPASPAAAKRTLKKKLAGLAREAHPLKTSSKPGPPRGSRVGGLPFLPADDPWPVCATCARPLTFFLQLDLDDLPLQFDATGLLQLFRCSGCAPAAPAAKEQLLRRLSASEGERRAAPEGTKVLPLRTITGAKKPKPDLPRRPEDHDQPVLGLELDVHAELCLAGDKLGGWPHWIQDASWPLAPLSQARCDRLLLQLDTGGALGDELGDGGIGFLLSAAAAPEEVVFVWQCL